MEAFPASDDRTPTIAEDPALALSQRAKLEILFAVMLGLFLGALDQTIVGPALPTIVTQLSGNDYYVWAVTIYLLTSTITVPFWGKLSDIYGRKPIFMIGIVIFLIGSALSGLSQNMGMLILFRGIQGIGAGSLFPVALAVIGDLFSPAERGKYQGLFGAVFGVAFVAGPLVGGWLTENAGWHWIFYVNIPIGIVALAVIQRLLPVVRTPSATRNFDILGGAIFTVAISFLLIGLTNKQFGEWTDPTVGGFILIGIVGSILFAFAERRAKEPIVPLDLWKSRAYSASMVSVFFAAFAFFGAIVFLPRWFQVVEGFSPTNSGLAALPLVIGLIGSSIISGILVSRTGRYKWLLVGSIALIGVATLLMTQLTKDTPLPIVWSWMFLAGLGVGPTFSVFTIVIQNAVPVPPARCGDVEPHVLPPDRRLDRAGVRRHDLRHDVPGRPRPADGRGRRATQVVAGFQQAVASGRRRLQSADRRRRYRRHDPRRQLPAARPGGAGHRSGHPRRVQPGRRPDFLARRHRVDRRGTRGAWRSRSCRSALRTQRRARTGGAGASAHERAGSRLGRPRPPPLLLTAPVAPPSGPFLVPCLFTFRSTMGPMTSTRRHPPRRLPASAPGRREPAMRRSAPMLDLAELPEGTMRRVTVGELDVLLVNTDRGIFATDDRCPHMSAPLSIGDLDGCILGCPLHEGRSTWSAAIRPRCRPTGGLDADGDYHPTWSPAGKDPKVDPPGKKAEARRLTRVRRLRYYPRPDRGRRHRGGDPAGIGERAVA